MAQLEMSSAFADAYTTRMTHYRFGNSLATSGLLQISNGNEIGNPSTCTLHIMKGTIPVDFVTSTERNADRLIMYNTSVNPYGNAGGIDDFTGFVTITNNIVNVNTKFAAAVASGQASWFWWTVHPYGNGDGYDYSTLYQQIIGTVGVSGSGADLEIPDVNIVSGTPYKITNLALRFPTVWTF